MLKDEVRIFLSGIHPFNFLSKTEIDNLLEGITLEFFPRGIKILQQDGPPSENLYVIKKGGIKVYLESNEEGETIIDYRGEGEQFGFLSMVSGDRSRANVLAIEDTIAYLIPKANVLRILRESQEANQYFLKSFFINFIDRSYDETRKKYGGACDTERVLFTTKVGELIRREPVCAGPDTTIQQAAAVMVENNISSVVVVENDDLPVGMLTDRDLREKVVARGLAVSNPIRSIMSSTLITIEEDELCFEALLRMMHHKIHHLLVLAKGELRGLVTNHDFMILQGASPTVLVKEIEKTWRLEELRSTSHKLSKAAAVLLREGAKAYNITGFITEIYEKIINRVVDILEKDLGCPPTSSYTLFMSGSGGRRELTFFDQHIKLGIIYEVDQEAGSSGKCLPYFTEFADRFNKSFAACCYIRNDGDYLEIDRIKRMTDWREHLAEWAETPGKYPWAPDYFEMRAIRGEAKPVFELRDQLLECATADNKFVALLAAATIRNRPPLGFFKKFVVEKSGEHKDELNLLEKGITPLVEMVRIFTVEQGRKDISTMKRLHKLKTQNGFEKADEIGQAFDYLLTYLVHHQLQQLEKGMPPVNFINPDSLSDLEKKTIKESFLLIEYLCENIEKKYRAEGGI